MSKIPSNREKTALPVLPKVLAISEENLSMQTKQTSRMVTIRMINLGVAAAALDNSNVVAIAPRASHQRDSEWENGNVGSMFRQRLVRFTRLSVGPVTEDHPISNPEK